MYTITFIRCEKKLWKKGPAQQYALCTIIRSHPLDKILKYEKNSLNTSRGITHYLLYD